MSLLQKKISFSIYKITKIKDEDAFLTFLSGFPPRDIKEEPIIDTYFFTDPIDTDKGGYHLTHDSLSFCYRSDRKPIGKKRLNILLKDELERIKNEEGRTLDKKKDKQEIQILTYEVAKRMSVGQNPVETTIQIIIDRDTNTLFVEKRGTTTEDVVSLLAYHGGVFCEKIIPFSGEDKLAKNKRLRDFTSWLYRAMAQKSNYIESGDIKLGSNIKLQDKDSEVAIKGNITKYLTTYNTMMDEGRVKECRVFYDDKENKLNLQYSLNCQDLCFASYVSSAYLSPKNQSLIGYHTIEERREDLVSFVAHFKSLAEYFEESMALETNK
jgi:hypothetical protein